MMTPKEKAEELVQKYLNTIIHFPYIDTEDGNCIGSGYMTHNSAVRCAINAVDEVLNAITFNMYDEDAYNKENNFWEAVKLELENI